MHPTRSDEITSQGESIEGAKDDILSAWSILENLSVSMDQIGGYFSKLESRTADDPSRSVGDALCSYLDPSLIQKIADARSRLSRYVSDVDAEMLAEKIPYWDYRLTKS